MLQRIAVRAFRVTDTTSVYVALSKYRHRVCKLNRSLCQLQCLQGFDQRPRQRHPAAQTHALVLAFTKKYVAQRVCRRRVALIAIERSLN